MTDLTFFPSFWTGMWTTMAILDYVITGRVGWSTAITLGLAGIFPVLSLLDSFIPKKIDERFKDAETLEDIKRILQEEEEQRSTIK